MANSRKRRPTKGSGGTAEIGESGSEGGFGSNVAPGTTGRYLILLREDAVKAGLKVLTETQG